MFKRVENELELAMFNGIWTTVWMEKGYELEFSDQALERIVVVTQEGHYVGTSEIKPYSPERSAINSAFAFSEHPLVQNAGQAIAEIDKMALLKPYRGKFISDLLTSAVYVAERLHIRYFVSLLEPVFLRALQITFKVPLAKLGDKRFYKGDYIVPVLFDMAHMYENKQLYNWLDYSLHASSATSGKEAVKAGMAKG